MFGPVREASKGLPVGIYTATFQGCEPVPENVEKGYKEATKFLFKVMEGDLAGAIGTRICCGSTPTNINNLGKFLSELTGIPLAPGANFDVAYEAAKGKPFTIIVKQAVGGGTRVDTVMPKK